MGKAEKTGVKLGQDDSLDAWSEFVNGDRKCQCDHAYEGLGRLHGIDMGKGWVRISTHPTCPHHGTEAQQERKRRTRGSAS